MRRSNFIVFLILVIWFVISFVANILGPLMPTIIDNYQLSLTPAAFLPFSSFLAYGIMSIPAGMMIEKLGEKLSMLIAFGLTFTGSLLFAFFPVMGQLVFGSASFISPHVFTYLMRALTDYDGQGNFLLDSLSRLIPENLPWSSLYWIFAFVFILMLLIIGLVKLPAVELKEEERTGAVQTIDLSWY